MSETPRTNAVYDASRKLGLGSVVDVPKGYPPSDPWELSRELERELATIREQNKELIAALKEIKRQVEPSLDPRCHFLSQLKARNIIKVIDEMEI